MTPAQEKKMDDLTDEVRDIKTALIGNNANGNQGLVQEFFKEQKRIQALYDLRNQAKGVSWVLGILWVVVTFVIPFVISWLYNR